MKNFLRKVIIKIINFLDLKLFWIRCDYFYKGKINLNIYNLHSTRPKDFNYYKKILKYINSRSKPATFIFYLHDRSKSKYSN